MDTAGCSSICACNVSTSLKSRKRERIEGLDSYSYSKLNKKDNLAPPILSSFMPPKLVLKVQVNLKLQEKETHELELKCRDETRVANKR